MARMLPSEAERILANVPDQFIFHCYDGRKFWNLRDLAEAVSSMSGDVFSHHVTAERNDFANWVADVIGDHVLARELWQTRSVATTMRRIAERVVFLESRRS